jgi:hypothetical protein
VTTARTQAAQPTAQARGRRKAVPPGIHSARPRPGSAGAQPIAGRASRHGIGGPRFGHPAWPDSGQADGSPWTGVCAGVSHP